MPRVPKPKRVLEPEDGDYYHVRMRPNYLFSTFRVPGWAARVSQTVSKDSKVRMAKIKSKYADRYRRAWVVNAVLVRQKYRNKQIARRVAPKITRKIES